MIDKTYFHWDVTLDVENHNADERFQRYKQNDVSDWWFVVSLSERFSLFLTEKLFVHQVIMVFAFLEVRTVYVQLNDRLSVMKEQLYKVIADWYAEVVTEMHGRGSKEWHKLTFDKQFLDWALQNKTDAERNEMMAGAARRECVHAR